MKPTWADAPDWAEYLVRYPNASYWWYESRPIQIHCGWYSLDGRSQMAIADWKNSLEERPEERA